MQCTNPVPLYFSPRGSAREQQAHIDWAGKKLKVPCGKCLAFRIARVREWSIRLLHESTQWEDAVFLTLTYNDDNLPFEHLNFIDKKRLDFYPGCVASKFSVLKKEHLQNYFKRLRKKLGERKIKYYACGEYGEQSQRPHYHCIIFGLSITEFPNEKGKVIGGELMELWDMGFQYVGYVSPDSIQYVCKYVDQKYVTSDKSLLPDGIPSPFQICSQGLGLEYARVIHSSILKDGYVRYLGKPASIPRYYQRKLDIPKSMLRERGESESIGDVMSIYNKHGLQDDYNVEKIQIEGMKQKELTLIAKEKNLRDKKSKGKA